MQEFSQYGGGGTQGVEYPGDYSFDSGNDGGYSGGGGESETELDMITDDGDVDEEVRLTFSSIPSYSLYLSTTSLRVADVHT